MQLANEVKDVTAFGSVVHKLPGEPKSQACGCIVESTTMTLFDGGIQTQEDDKQCFGCCATTYRAHKHGRCKGSSDTPCTPHTARSRHLTTPAFLYTRPRVYLTLGTHHQLCMLFLTAGPSSSSRSTRSSASTSPRTRPGAAAASVPWSTSSSSRLRSGRASSVWAATTICTSGIMWV